MAKRNFKREYELQKKRGDTKGQLERQRARRLLDKKKKLIKTKTAKRMFERVRTSITRNPSVKVANLTPRI